MPRRSILSPAERDSLLALPDTKDELIRHYTFNATDLSIIRQHRGPANQPGLCRPTLLHAPSWRNRLGVEDEPFAPLLRMVAGATEGAGREAGLHMASVPKRAASTCRIAISFRFPAFRHRPLPSQRA